MERLGSWEVAGEIGVDAGLCWVGDPCYCVTPDGNEHPAPTWSEFCDKLAAIEHGNVAQWKYKMGHAGLGVSVETGYGDGCYKVYVRRNAEGRVMRVMVDFSQEFDDTEEPDEDA